MRSVWKFPFFDKHIFRVICKFAFEDSILRSRRSSFFFEGEMSCLVYNGVLGVRIHYPITEYIYLLQFGQFSFTKKRTNHIHKLNVIHLKNVKKKKLFLLKAKRKLRTAKIRKN